MTHSDYRQYKSGFQPFTIQNSKISSTAQTKAKEKSQTLSAMTRHVSSNDSVR